MVAENTLGFRDDMKQHMLNHYSALYNMKPMIKFDRSKPIKKEEKKAKRPNSSFAKKIREGKKLTDGFGETRHMFKKLQSGVKPTGNLIENVNNI